MWNGARWGLRDSWSFKQVSVLAWVFVRVPPGAAQAWCAARSDWLTPRTHAKLFFKRFVNSSQKHILCRFIASKHLTPNYLCWLKKKKIDPQTSTPTAYTHVPRKPSISPQMAVSTEHKAVTHRSGLSSLDTNVCYRWCSLHLQSNKLWHVSWMLAKKKNPKNLLDIMKSFFQSELRCQNRQNISSYLLNKT